jgi:hypothetical protein
MPLSWISSFFGSAPQTRRTLPALDLLQENPLTRSKALLAKENLGLFSHYVHDTAMSPKDVLELTDQALRQQNASAVSILAERYPEIVNAKSVTERLDQGNVDKLTFAYSVLVECANGNMADSLKPLCPSEKPHLGVTTMFDSKDDAIALKGFLTHVKSSPQLSGSFWLRTGEKHDGSLGRFSFEHGQIKSENFCGKTILEHDGLSDPLLNFS